MLKWLVIVLLFTGHLAEAKQKRSYHSIKQFKLDNPCPANGRYKGRCEGFIIDHRIGLCVGGLDSPKNMRWMTVSEAKKKDRWECKDGWQIKLNQCEINSCFIN